MNWQPLSRLMLISLMIVIVSGLLLLPSTSMAIESAQVNDELLRDISEVDNSTIHSAAHCESNLEHNDCRHCSQGCGLVLPSFVTHCQGLFKTPFAYFVPDYSTIVVRVPLPPPISY